MKHPIAQCQELLDAGEDFRRATPLCETDRILFDAAARIETLERQRMTHDLKIAALDLELRRQRVLEVAGGTIAVGRGYLLGYLDLSPEKFYRHRKN